MKSANSPVSGIDFFRLLKDLLAKKSVLPTLLICALALSGCGSAYGPQITTVNYYPDCYAPIQELRQAESDFSSNMLLGTMLGALAGAAVGLASTGDGRGALIGAAGGAAAGAVGSHIYSSHQENQREADRLTRYAYAITEDMERIDSVMLAARAANRCYEQQYARLVGRYESGRISQIAFETRLEEIRNGMTEAEAILGAVSTDVISKQADYRASLEEEAQAQGRPVPQLATSGGPDRAVQTSGNRPLKPGYNRVQTASNRPLRAGENAVSATSSGASNDPLYTMAAQANALELRRLELEAERERMRSRLEQYDRAQEAMTGV